jgi:large subunit ribosomal protein L17
MRHQNRKRKLNRKAPHRKSMLANMATSLFDKERIMTTLPRAKEVRHTAERLITYAKRGGLHAVRLAAVQVRDESILKKLFETIAPSFKDRNGGYTRIIHADERIGDNAPMCYIELVGTSEKLKAAAIAAAEAEATAKKKPAPAKAVSKPKEEKATEPAKGEKAEEKTADKKKKSVPKTKGKSGEKKD